MNSKQLSSVQETANKNMQLLYVWFQLQITISKNNNTNNDTKCNYTMRYELPQPRIFPVITTTFGWCITCSTVISPWTVVWKSVIPRHTTWIISIQWFTIKYHTLLSLRQTNSQATEVLIRRVNQSKRKKQGLHREVDRTWLMTQAVPWSMWRIASRTFVFL